MAKKKEENLEETKIEEKKEINKDEKLTKPYII